MPDAADPASDEAPARRIDGAAARPASQASPAARSQVAPAAGSLPTVFPATDDADAQAGADPVALSPANPAEAPNLGRAFLRGMVWSTLALIVSKLASLISTVALALIFRQREYGAFASARGLAIIGDTLTDGGMRHVLISRGRDDYPLIARPAFRISLTFNLVGCLLMFGTAGFVHEPGVAPQLIVTAIALVLATFGSVQRARLATDLRFARSAFMYTISALLRNVLTVGFALAGLGPLSFALPLIFVATWEAIYARRLVGALPAAPVRTPGLTRDLLAQGKWVIFATLGASLIARGDYLVASRYFATPDGAADAINIAGQYMFAFQLTIGLFSPLTLGLQTVIQPVMAQLRSDPARQAEAFRRMIRVAVFLATPASLISIGLTPLLIHPIKHGYWDTTAAAIQVLAASECVRQLYLMSVGTLEASGRFKTSAVVVGIDGLLTVLAALIGCLCGGTLLSLTIAVAIQRALTAMLQALYTYHLAGGGSWLMLRTIVPPLLIGGAIAGGLGVGVDALSRDGNGYRWLLAIAGVVSVPLFFAASMLVTPGRVHEAWELLGARLVRRATN